MYQLIATLNDRSFTYYFTTKEQASIKSFILNYAGYHTIVTHTA